MRRIIVLAAAPLVLFGCANDPDDTDGAAPPPETGMTTDPADPADPASDSEPDETPSGSTGPDGESTADATTPPPDPADRSGESPSTTLELAPRRTEAPPTTVTDGPPLGTEESLYPGQIDPGLAPFVEQAAADLADRLGTTRDRIEVISATLVTWPDSSLGCPQPGMEYLQVLQDGSLIELGHDGRVYRYHSGGNRTPFLCDQPLAAPPVSGGAAGD